jgi:phage gpG-like protein
MGEAFVAEFNDENVRDFLKSVLKKTEDVKGQKKKYVGILSSIVYQDVMDHFKREKGSEGPWKDWSKSYTKHMEKIGRGSNQKLQFDGRLRNNFKKTDYKTSAKGILWFNDAKTASGFPYAAAHDNGGPKLPQRDFMWLSDQAMEKMTVQTLQFMIDEGV